MLNSTQFRVASFWYPGMSMMSVGSCILKIKFKPSYVLWHGQHPITSLSLVRWTFSWGAEAVWTFLKTRVPRQTSGSSDSFLQYL